MNVTALMYFNKYENSTTLAKGYYEAKPCKRLRIDWYCYSGRKGVTETGDTFKRSIFTCHNKEYVLFKYKEIT